MQAVTFFSLAETKILPGDKSIEKAFLKSDSYIMGYSIKQKGTYFEIGNYKTGITLDNQKFDVKATLIFHNSYIKWKDDFVANANSFKTIRSNSDIDDDVKLILNFSNNISDEFKNKKKVKKLQIK